MKIFKKVFDKLIFISYNNKQIIILLIKNIGKNE